MEHSYQTSPSFLKDFNKLFIEAASESSEGGAVAYLEPVVVGRDREGGREP